MTSPQPRRELTRSEVMDAIRSVFKSYDNKPWTTEALVESIGDKLFPKPAPFCSVAWACVREDNSGAFFGDSRKEAEEHGYGDDTSRVIRVEIREIESET